jgi:hypothetical protein
VPKSHNPQVKALEVKKRFEPSRLAAECLAQAYERLVPILRRPVPPQQAQTSLPDSIEAQPKERRRS